MALLGITKKFSANHVSRVIKHSEFYISLVFQEDMDLEFVGNIDHSLPNIELDNVINQLEDRYLDDIVGRATDENITLFIMKDLVKLKPHSFRLNVDGRYIELLFSEVDFDMYPSRLAYNKGHSLLLRENPKLAIEEFEKAIELKNDFAEAYNMRGRCYKYLDRWDSALLDFMKSIRLKPDFGEAYRNLGNACYYLNDDNNMIPAFDKSIELMPNSALAYNNRGFAYQKLGKYDLAVMNHSKAIELDPNYAEAYMDRGNAFKAQGMIDLAQKDFSKADELEISGNDTYAGIKMY